MALPIAIGATVIYEGEKAAAVAVTVVAFSCGFFYNGTPSILHDPKGCF
jgi:hypothetical protein